MSQSTIRTLTLFVIVSAALWSAAASHRAASAARPSALVLPALPREFRAAWVATVANIDWPSKPGLPVAQQKAELIAIMNKAVDLNLNAIVFQVRPACDALYKSEYEPWSEYLTGAMGRAPESKFDPLEFAIHEAHLRGLELHAWFNPYRAHHSTGHSPICSDHISVKHPDVVKSYGKDLWLDPGEPEVQAHSLKVIMDVVKRYDVDGVHLDDYFYPYKVKDIAGNNIDFPDEHSYQRYLSKGGALGREDWRRENVNSFIERLYKSIKAKKKWVKFGISPFGIWRPGNPKQIQGYDQYNMLYADAKKWLNNGWVDYWTPQLYWKIDPPAQSYPVLLKWWVEQNTQQRNLWPGNYTSRVSDSGSAAWPASEIVRQIEKTRDQPGATGNVHFSMKALLRNSGGLADALKSSVYAAPALVPASPWLSDEKVHEPTLHVKADGDIIRAKWKSSKDDHPWLWAVCTHTSSWATRVYPGNTMELAVSEAQLSRTGRPNAVAVYPIDRCGVAGPPAVWTAP